jgi:hypothetical protein
MTSDAPARSPLNLGDQCQDTASRFAGAVPRYRLDWIVVSYSRVATGAFWDTLLVVASGRTRPGKDQVRPLALTAVLSYCSRQPQDTPPNPPCG